MAAAAALRLKTACPDSPSLCTNFLSVYRSSALLSTRGILSVDPCSSQNLATWSRKLSLILVWASSSFSL